MTAAKILCLNGSLRGRDGNTARILDHLRRVGENRAAFAELTLAELHASTSRIEEHLRDADAFLACSGVYWNSHGSAMQRFVEVVTRWEATDVFMGKPVGIVVSMDSVGGMEVAARLMSVFNLLGCVAPPLATVVLSRIGQLALKQSPQQDVYNMQDAELLVENLITATALRHKPWHSWPVKATRDLASPYPSPGALDIDHEPWIDPG